MRVETQYVGDFEPIRTFEEARVYGTTFLEFWDRAHAATQRIIFPLQDGVEQRTVSRLFVVCEQASAQGMGDIEDYNGVLDAIRGRSLTPAPPSLLFALWAKVHMCNRDYDICAPAQYFGANPSYCLALQWGAGIDPVMRIECSRIGSDKTIRYLAY